MDRKFSLNEIVKGRVAGTFFVLAYEWREDRWFVRVKECDRVTGKVYPGEMLLTEDALRPV